MNRACTANSSCSARIPRIRGDEPPPEDGGANGGGDGFGGGQMDSVFSALALDGIGQMASLPIPRATVEWLGFDGAMTLRADLQALAERHPEYYHGDSDAVLSDIQFVLADPDDWFIHHGARVVIFRERVGSGSIPLVRIELDVVGSAFVARSVYVSGKVQIAKKMGDKKRVLGRLGRSGQSSGSLSVAEYLSALGNGSQRPVPPSGGSPKAQ